MATTLIKLAYDATGVLAANKVENELHLNIDPLTKMIIPKFGRFFSEGLTVYENVSTTLVKGVHYVTADFDQQESLSIGKEICKSIIIIDSRLGNSFSITYQALGGDYSYNNDNLLACVQDKLLPYLPVAFTDITEKPQEYLAQQHLHGMDTVYGFEHIVGALNRLYHGLTIGPFPSYESLVSYCDTALIDLEQKMIVYLDDNMQTAIDEFKSKFNKTYFGIESIENLSAATHEEGYLAGDKNFDNGSYSLNKYITLDALIGLKKSLFERLVTKQSVGLGINRAIFSNPVKNSFTEARNGSVTNFITKIEAIESSTTYDPEIYPKTMDQSSNLIVQKISNNLRNGGGVFIAHDQTSHAMFIATLESDSPTEAIVWKKLPNSYDASYVSDPFETHLKDFVNPHFVNKAIVGLGLVEDLSILTEAEVMALRSTRKYITFDNLIKFMETYMVDKGLDYSDMTSSKTAKTNTTPEYLIDNCVVVYSPPGTGCTKPTAENDCVDPPIIPGTTAVPITTRPPTTTPMVTTTLPPTTTTTIPPTTTTTAPTTTRAPTTSKPPVLTKTITVELGPNASYGLLGTMIGYIKLDTGTGLFTYGFTGNYITYNKSDHDISSGSSDYNGYVSFRTPGGSEVLMTNVANRTKIASLGETYHYSTATAMSASQFNSITKAYYERTANATVANNLRVTMGNSVSFATVGNSDIINVSITGATPGTAYTVDWYIKFTNTGSGSYPSTNFEKNTSIDQIEISHPSSAGFMEPGPLKEFTALNSTHSGTFALFENIGPSSKGKYEMYVVVYPKGQPASSGVKSVNNVTTTMQ